MTTRRYFANAAPQRTLSGSITSGATSCTVSGTFAGWPVQFPFYATLDIGTASAEVVSVTAIASSVATIVRGQDGTAAVSHAAGATLDQTVVRQDFDEANAHTSSNAGVHGVSGSVVGTSDAQTLTNKTLSSPTVTGTSAGTNATLSGTLTVAGVATLNGAASATAAGTGLAVTNNATVGGNLTVTGTTTAGVVIPRLYTTEAARDAAITSPTVGMIVYLTAPTKMATPGPTQYDGTRWGPDGITRVVGVAPATDLASTLATEVMGYSQAVPLVAGRRYRVNFCGYLNGGGLANIRVRFDTAAVTNTSTQAGSSFGIFFATTGSAGRFSQAFTKEFVAPTTATYNIAIGATGNATTALTILGSVIPTEITIDDVGV